MTSITESIDALFARPAEQGISLAVAVFHDGTLIADRYGIQPETAFGPAEAVTPDTPLISWSMAKSFVHAAVGLLVADGRLDLDAPAAIPEWSGTPKASITVPDLLEMRPGLRFVEDYVDGETSHCLAMLFGEGADDHAAYAGALPLDHPPGSVWNYSSGTTNLICRIIGDIIGGGADGVRKFLTERLFGPAGLTTASVRFDAAGTWVGSSYVYATAADFGRFGELYRLDGVGPDGRRILPEGWAEHGRTFVAHDPADDLAHGFDYGRHWWMWPQFPGSMAAHGYEGQYIITVPDRRLTIVHLGKTPAEQRHHVVMLLSALIEAVAV